MKIAIPEQVSAVLALLEQHGFECCVVGGCVRDSLMGITPHDWDITTSALPDQTMRALGNLQLIPTGQKHGTITAMCGGMAIEVTTYRVDGTYSDSRRPDSVRFTPNLREDLARRDFTANALAYNPATGIVDCFGGVDDIQNGVLRCVGDPDLRFGEDALRILRGARFASVLGFSIAPTTARSMLQNRGQLDKISAERVLSELTKLLCGDHARAVLLDFAPVITQIIPELAPCIGFHQHNPHHRYTVYEHIVRSVEAAPPHPVHRFAMLLHDIGKPDACTTDETGVCHFYGHEKISMELAAVVMRRLRASNDLSTAVCKLVAQHDIPITPDERLLRRRLNQFGEAFLRQLFAIKRADLLSRGVASDDSAATLSETERLMDDILAQKQCFSLRDLAVDGNDLIAAGIPKSTQIGSELHRLLALVVDGQCPNTKVELLAQLRRAKP